MEEERAKRRREKTISRLLRGELSIDDLPQTCAAIHPLVQQASLLVVNLREKEVGEKQLKKVVTLADGLRKRLAEIEGRQ